LTFSNFGFGFSGSVLPALTASDVMVVPTTDSSGDVTLQFQGDFSAGAGMNESAKISYMAVAGSAVITGESIAMAGFSQSGTGGINIGESICVGGMYLSTGACTGSSVASIGVFDNGPTDMRTFDSVTFTASQSAIAVVKDISVSGGGSGSNATVSEVFNTSNSSGGGGGTGGGPVPEPDTVVMMASGLLVTALAWRRRRHA
jgi:hypothetical protein